MTLTLMLRYVSMMILEARWGYAAIDMTNAGDRTSVHHVEMW